MNDLNANNNQIAIVDKGKLSKEDRNLDNDEDMYYNQDDGSGMAK